MSIPKFFYVGSSRLSESEVEPTLLQLSDEELLSRNIERDRVRELKTWLLKQPNDTKLLFTLNVNWDNHETILLDLLEDPNLDRAVVARIFWGSQTFNTEYEHEGAATSIIVRNLARGYYKTSELELNRCDLMSIIHGYLHHTVPHLGVTAKKLPKELCGPFIGRSADATHTIDHSTAESLVDIFDGETPFPFTYEEHCQNNSDFWPEETGFLTPVSALRLGEMADADDTTYLEHIYGNHAAYVAAANRHFEPSRQEFERRWKPFNTAVKNGWKPKEFWDEDFKPPPYWLTIDRNEMWTNLAKFLKGFFNIWVWTLLLAVLAVGVGLIARRITKGTW